MRLSLKAKLTALITLLVLLVVLVTSTVYISNLTQQALLEIQSKGEYVANEVYHQARTVLAQSRLPAGTSPSDFEQVRRFVQSRLAEDQGLASLIESAVGYSATLYYVAITDTGLQVLVHSDPGEVGQPFSPAPAYSQLLRAGLVRQLRVIFGPPQVYEVDLPIEIGDQPLGAVRVGVSTVFLRSQLTPQLRAALALSLLAIAFATLSAGVLSFRLLRPLETIARGVDRMAHGEYSQPFKLDRRDEWGILSSKLNLLGEHMRGEKAAFVQLKENLDQLFSRLSDGLLLFDNQDRLVLATPAVERFLGVAPADLVHRTAEDLFAREAPLHNLLRVAFESRQSVGWDTLEMHGESVSRVAISAQFVEEGGERVGCLVTLRDASTRADIEDQIDTTTKLAALGRLMSGVAHEVKNPLNAMVLQLEILKSKLDEQGETVTPQINILAAEIRRLDRVVKIFLDFTRPVEIHPTETDIQSLVQEVFALAEPQARQNNVQLVFESDGALPRVSVDRDLLKQALLNLVLNGCQAMPSGGDLKVTPRTEPHRLELEITDQGVGIPPEEQKKIFSLFYTTKPGGTGIGLAMAFRILQLHNGSIDFSSEVNRGSTFRLSLPI
jgi:signal transduction histidine kinase